MKMITQRRHTRPRRVDGTDSDFICHHCGAYVSADAAISGVRNRNHCPYCLASRHLDLFEAGDRLAACRGTMTPVGLTLKWANKRYPGRGELMLVHVCQDCGRLSLNRIARDDDTERLRSVLDQADDLSEETQAALAQQRISLLDTAQADLVR